MTRGINMRGKAGVISDCRVSLGIIDEGDNNDTHAEEKKNLDFRFLTRANGPCTKFVEGSSVFVGKAKYSS